MISILAHHLKPVLTGLAKVVSKKAALECLGCIRVDFTPEQTRLTGTDLTVMFQIVLPNAVVHSDGSFLLPLEPLRAVVRRVPPQTVIRMEKGRIYSDLDSGTITEEVKCPKLDSFPEEPEVSGEQVIMPDTFPQRFVEAMECSSTDDTRYILNGTFLDVSGPKNAGHYLVGTNGTHLFSANSFTLPIKASVIIPNHKLFMWPGLSGPWALGSQKKHDSTYVRITGDSWKLTVKTLDGNYPNWRQVVKPLRAHRTTVVLPDTNEFGKIVRGLDVGELTNNPVDLVIKDGQASVQSIIQKTPIPLEGATATGPDQTVRINQTYLAKAFDYGLTRIGIIDEITALQFTREGRQMTVMPLRISVDPIPKDTQPAPPEPQPERKTMPDTNGANRSIRPETPADKPALETAIEKLDVFKVTVRETLAGINELTTLLRQAVRDQKTGEKEINNVRQTLRSLQSVRI